MKRTTSRREDRRVEVIKLSIPSRPVKQMTEKLQLVDAGLAERERTGGLPRSRAPLEKSKRLPSSLCKPCCHGAFKVT